MDFENTLLNFKDLKQRLQYAVTLPEKLMLDLCAKNTELNQTVCLNDEYWKLRYLTQREAPKTEPKSWKELYLFPDTDGNVWSFGNNEDGQLGLGDSGTDTERIIPTQIPNIKAKQISCGSAYSMIIDINDNVWSFGNNEDGQLGLGDSGEGTDINTPKQIPNIKAKQIACGYYHSMIIDMNDNVWSFGDNDNGQLGLGDSGEETNRTKPAQIPGIKAKQIACGYYHSMIIDINDNVWSFGNNGSVLFKNNGGGQLGLGDNTNRNTPTQIPNIKATQISCGDDFSMIIDTNSNVWSFGHNYYGQLGLGDNGVNTDRNKPTQIPDIKAKQIACGRDHAMIIDTDNNVMSFGFNYRGQLGLGDNGENVEENMDRNKPTQIQDIKAKQIACGDTHSMIIDTNNQVWSFGNNEYGQLGTYDNDDINIPTQIHIPSGINSKQIACGDMHSIILTNIQTLSPFDEITNMFSQGQIVKFEIEHNLQIQYKALEGIYIGTFTDKQGQKKYGYIRYNSQTNQILKP